MLEKRSLLVLLFAALLMILVGCSDQSSKYENENRENNREEEQEFEFSDDVEEEAEEETEEARVQLAENVTKLNDIEATQLDDIDKSKWKKIQQNGGIDNRIYYGNEMIIRSENQSPSAGTYKFDLNAGEAIWQDNLMTYSGSSRLQLEDGILYVVKLSEILGVNEKTGEVVYEYELPDSGTVKELYLVDEYLLVSYGSDLLLYDRESQELLWKFPYQAIKYIGNVEHKIPYANGHFLLGFEREKVVAVEAATGEEKWSIELPQLVGNVMAANDEAIYVFNDYSGAGSFNIDKTIAKYDVEAQELISEVTLESDRTPLGHYPILTEEQLIYVATDFPTQSIVSLNHDLTEEQWVVSGNNYLFSHVIYDNGNVYAVAEDDELDEFYFITIDAATGDVKEKIILEGGKSTDQDTFYTYDGKVYIHMNDVPLGEDEFYYIFDEEDVTRPLP